MIQTAKFFCFLKCKMGLNCSLLTIYIAKQIKSHHVQRILYANNICSLTTDNFKDCGANTLLFSPVLAPH